MSVSRRAAAWVAIVILALAPTVLAQDVVEIDVPVTVEVRGAEQAIAKVVVRVRPGFHVQANPVLNPDLIPIVLSFDDTDAVRIGSPRYPAPSRLRLRGTDEDLLVLDGAFVIGVPVRLERAPKAGSVSLTGRLRYQACDDTHCLFPRSQRVEMTLRRSDEP